MPLKLELFLIGLVLIFAIPFFFWMLKEMRNDKQLAKQVEDGAKFVLNEVSQAGRLALPGIFWIPFDSNHPKSSDNNGSSQCLYTKR